MKKIFILPLLVIAFVLFSRSSPETYEVYVSNKTDQTLRNIKVIHPNKTRHTLRLESGKFSAGDYFYLEEAPLPSDVIVTYESADNELVESSLYFDMSISELREESVIFLTITDESVSYKILSSSQIQELVKSKLKSKGLIN